jgi:hypothetical protein
MRFLRRQKWPGFKLTTQFRRVLKLRMNEIIPSLPLHVHPCPAEEQYIIYLILPLTFKCFKVTRTNIHTHTYVCGYKFVK